MHQLNDKIYKIGPVNVTRHPIDWSQLGPDLRDFADVTFGRIKLLPFLASDHRYLNPRFSLFAPGEVAEQTFLRQANRACMLWMRQLKKVVGTAGVRRFQLRESEPADRMKATSGFLVLSGRIVHIKRLNEVRQYANA